MTSFGTYTGYIVGYLTAFKGVYPSSQDIIIKEAKYAHHLFIKSYFKMAFGSSLLFLSLNEILTSYFDKNNFYSNFWSNYTISAYVCYKAMILYCRNVYRVRPESAAAIIF